MQRKLKAAFRSSSRKKGESGDDDRTSSPSSPTSPISPRVGRRGASLDERRDRRSIDSIHEESPRNGRSRPLSSAYDSHRVGNATGAGSQHVSGGHAQSRSGEPATESIANDYQAYLPALSPVYDSHDEPQMSLGGDRRLITGESTGRHEEDVADRNMEQYRNSLDVSKRKPLPAPPVVDTEEDAQRKYSTGVGSTLNSATSTNSKGKYSLGGNSTTRGGLVDRTPPHAETSAHERNQWKKSGLPTRDTQDEAQLEFGRRRPRGSSNSDNDTPRPPPHNPRLHKNQNGGGVGGRIPISDGNDDIKREIDQLLEGVVDLRNTVDTDQDVRFAPAVTHEVIKPHQHEVIQHKVFREIHNYDYYHRIQPVYDLEVLPPRHWIPNPDGEGLIEIDADELPSRTGKNRRWKIIREDVQIPAEMRPTIRTEPEIIEHPTTITPEGIERKETTIIHPPTLQDMTEYDGLVQPVHFDHKTKKHWLGEITTMHNLRNELGQVVDPAEPDAFALNELAEHLPHVPEVSDVPALSPTTHGSGRRNSVVKRKPVKADSTIRMVGQAI